MGQRTVACVAMAALWAGSAAAQESVGSGASTAEGSTAQGSVLPSSISLAGELVRVRWSDGDSFRILDGQYAGHGVRLSGYNALESYGPVHQWGTWTGEQLWELSQQAKDFAAAGAWSCTTDGSLDRYERLLIECPDLTTAMVGAGYGLLVVFDPSHPASPEALAAQRDAQEFGRGIWAGGVPAAVVTSLHSADENEGSGAPGDIYNRIVYTDDGRTEEVAHQDTYAVCQVVCLEQPGSCMVYVPYEQRYGDGRAECLWMNAARHEPSE